MVYYSNGIVQWILGASANQPGHWEKDVDFLDKFASRAPEQRIYDVTEFCKSEVFREAGYVFDERWSIISMSVM